MEVDPRSDVFSFGVSLFELITGRLPFEAPNDAALITRVASAQAPELREFRSDVPSGLEMVVQKALQKRVEKRYQTMEDLIADLRAPAHRNPMASQTRVGTSVKVPPGTFTNRTLRVVAASVMLSAAVVAAALYFSLPRRLFGGRAIPATQTPERMLGHQAIPAAETLVVLRLRNVNGDQPNRALADGLTELLTNRLSQVEQLQGSIAVVAPSEVFKVKKYPREEITDAEAARTSLGATLVLEGAVQRFRDRVIVTLSLVETRKQTILAGRDVEASIEKLSQLEGLLLEKAAEMLKVQVRPEADRALAVGLPANPRAYELYLQGRGYLQRFDRVDHLNLAIEAFQEAMARDPGYALAHAGVAEAYLRKYNATKVPELIDLARLSGQRAIQLNPALAPVHYPMGLIHAASDEYERAIDSFKSSIQIHPAPDAYRELANAYDASTRAEEAEATYRSAIQMRPLYWAGYRDLAVFYQTHGRFTEALPLFEKVVELAPDSYAGFANIGGLYLGMGKTSQAIEYFQRAISIKPTWGSYYNLGTAAYQEKRYADAIEMYKKATELEPSEAVSWATLGEAYARGPDSLDQTREAYAHAIKLTENELNVNPRNAKNWARIASWRVVSDKDRAIKEIGEALRLNPRDNFVLARAASVYEQSGMREEALVAVNSAVELGFPVAQLRSWPVLAQLLQDPRCTLAVERKPIDGPSAPTGPK
jgi:serine/threonine-protein kinase